MATLSYCNIYKYMKEIYKQLGINGTCRIREKEMKPLIIEDSMDEKNKTTHKHIGKGNFLNRV